MVRARLSIPNIFGIFVCILLAVVIVLCFVGNKAKPMAGFKFAFVGVGGLALLVMIVNFVIFAGGDYRLLAQMGSGGLRIGIFITMLMCAVIAAIPFIKPLEK
ncbi:MAG: hypothetical protein FWD90_07265 [Defluviitaleaceae bacterium]|nr:hypothetical protein [Defluviitaleaceae bacterium]